MNTTVLEKIQSELERSGCDAFPLSGGDNMRYAAQVHLPFTDEHPGLAFVLFAKGRLPLVLSPSLWARSWERGIISDVRAYPGSLDATHAAAELAAFLRPLGLASHRAGHEPRQRGPARCPGRMGAHGHFRRDQRHTPDQERRGGGFP